MSKNVPLILGVVALLIVAGGFLLFRGEGTIKQQPAAQQQAVTATGVSHTVSFGDTGFAPKELTVQQGDQVVFENQSSKGTWPATAIHPTHTIYPGSGILKCQTPEGEGMFDACGPVGSQESWSFVFGEKGSWGYHDHLNVAFTGRIIVQ